jgi:hypothetical protein
MGFPEDLSKLALIKVKNESVAAAVEAVVALQAEKLSSLAKESLKDTKKVTVVDWTCDACTMINTPGGTDCDMCGCKAPESAFVDGEAEKSKRLAEEKKLKEE